MLLGPGGDGCVSNAVLLRISRGVEDCASNSQCDFSFSLPLAYAPSLPDELGTKMEMVESQEIGCL